MGCLLATAPVLVELAARPVSEEALRYLGHAGQELDAGMVARLDACMQKCAASRARGVFRVLDPVDCADVLVGEDIKRHVEGAVAVVLMAATLGMESERLLRRETALSATDGLLLNALASSMAEDAAELLHAHIRVWARERGARAGGRFSPGYGDLPIEVQPRLVGALSADRLLGVSVTERCFLIPAKSVTAIIGLFADDGGEKALAGEKAAGGESSESSECAACDDCERCGMREACLLRKQGRSCHGGRFE